MALRVIVYHQPGCSACHEEMTWLKQNHISFESRDVLANLDWLDELMELGGQATPVTVIEAEDGQEVIFGFNQPQLQDLLAHYS